MADANSSETPLDAVAGTVGDRTADAFGVLGNETRLAILLVLWEAKVPGHPLSEQAVSFSELRKRVGMRDSGQFNYHLENLTDTFVEQINDGYILTTPGEQVLRAILAGTLTDQPSFDAEPIDSECNQCGAPVVIDYDDGTLIERCTNCEGAYRRPEEPSGLLAKGYRPPVWLEHRTPQEFHRHGNTWIRHRIMSMVEGVCPDCSGHVTAALHICEDHDTQDGTVCEHCRSTFEIRWLFVCEVCKFDLWVPGEVPIFTAVAVIAFFHEHGLDPHALYDDSATEVLHDAVERVAVVSDDPLKLAVTVELDSDRLTVTLDDEAHAIDVAEDPSETD